MMGRTTATASSLGDVHIDEGALIGLAFASGNFDQKTFPNPEACDISRKPNRHLTFGVGPHSCIGAPLARMEMRVVIDELLARTSSIRLAGDPVEVGGLRSGYDRLPVTVTPS